MEGTNLEFSPDIFAITKFFVRKIFQRASLTLVAPYLFIAVGESEEINITFLNWLQNEFWYF